LAIGIFSISWLNILGASPEVLLKATQKKAPRFEGAFIYAACCLLLLFLGQYPVNCLLSLTPEAQSMTIYSTRYAEVFQIFLKE
jgi:hypothetical protein